MIYLLREDHQIIVAETVSFRGWVHPGSDKHRVSKNTKINNSCGHGNSVHINNSGVVYQTPHSWWCLHHCHCAPITNELVVLLDL